jgi:hypothetical protein
MKCQTQTVIILFLSLIFAQAQEFAVPNHFIPFEDKSSYSQEFYRWPSEGYLWIYNQSRGDGGSYIGCREDAQEIRPKGFPKNLLILSSDMSELSINIFTIGCGSEVLSHGAGHFSYWHYLLGFEKTNKNMAYLLLGGEQEAIKGSVTSSISDLQRLDYGVYSFTRTSIGTWGYTQEYFLFSVSDDGITILIDALPLGYFKFLFIGPIVLKSLR